MRVSPRSGNASSLPRPGDDRVIGGIDRRGGPAGEHHVRSDRTATGSYRCPAVGPSTTATCRWPTITRDCSRGRQAVGVDRTVRRRTRSAAVPRRGECRQRHRRGRLRSPNGRRWGTPDGDHRCQGGQNRSDWTRRHGSTCLGLAKAGWCDHRLPSRTDGGAQVSLGIVGLRSWPSRVGRRRRCRRGRVSRRSLAYRCAAPPDYPATTALLGLRGSTSRRTVPPTFSFLIPGSVSRFSVYGWPPTV